MAAQLTLTLDDATVARLDSVAASRETDRREILMDAVQTYLADETYALEQIAAGLAEAERGEFATDEEVKRVLNRHRAG